MKVLIPKFGPVNIPDNYAKMMPQEGDSEGSVPYGTATENAYIWGLFEKLNHDETMPFDDPQLIIDSVHYYLNENQGLVEVDTGLTKHKKRKYAATIVKNKNENQGVCYILTFQLQGVNTDLNAQLFFDEIGVTGARDAAVCALEMKAGNVDARLNGWNRDPYDESFTDGFLMNLSEDAKYDGMFPYHPLTMARKFILAKPRAKWTCLHGHLATAAGSIPRPLGRIKLKNKQACPVACRGVFDLLCD